MLSKADFVRLRQHLRELRPAFKEFCKENDFEFVPRRALGRYPRIRIVREGPIKLYFDLQMDLDDEGNRFEEFSRDVPYSLYCGAILAQYAEQNKGTWFSKDFTCFSGKPFHIVPGILREEMEKYLALLRQFDANFLKEHGKESSFG
ncbi:MAG TPA: hypothetical protein VG944_07560 [Fimbriimonas sp.]|nr:hypothetical protein [Fimbriimonas sp.]